MTVASRSLSTPGADRPHRRAAIRGRAALTALAGGIVLMAGGCVPIGGGAETTPSGTAQGPPPEIPSADHVTVVEPDGGADYYAGFRDGLPSGPEFFPLGLWIGSVTAPEEALHERRLGLNLYVDLAGGSRLDFLADGQYAITSWRDPLSRGAVLGDEPDMWAGAGDGDWTGNYPGQGEICVDLDTGCGYTIQKELDQAVEQDRMTYANYGKGVTFWQSDSEASIFASGPQDVVSADNYWFTDPNICGAHEGGTMLEEPRQLSEAECRLPANYGWTVERVRSLVEPVGSIPVWSFVEVGQPSDAGALDPPDLPQIRAAVWSSIVHGARGIVYFGHSFGGPCQTFHVLRDCGAELADGMAEINAEVTDLAPVLNGPELGGALHVTGAADAIAKTYDGDLYVLATAASPEPGRVDFLLACAQDGDATVMGEDRTVAVSGGQFADDFTDGNAVHLYRLDGNSCDL